MRRYVSFLMVAGVLFVSGCKGGHESPPQRADGESVTVRALRVDVQSAEEPVQYSATIRPVEEANIAGKVMGNVERVYVTEGEVVTKGQRLVDLEGEDVRARLAQAGAGVTEARAHYTNTKKNLKRFETLFKEKAATQKELDDVHVAFEAAQARLRAAEEMEREVEDLLQYVRIVAPFDGVITRTDLDVGDLVTPGRPILKIENLRQLEVIASIPESQIEHLSVGMPVRIVIPSRPVDPSERLLMGSIDQIIPSADPGSHQFEIKVFIQNPDGAIKSGLFARIVINRVLEERLTVPREAVFRRGQLEGVYIVEEDGRAYLRWISTGREFAEGIEVLAGLDSGEVVVISSDSRLKDGQRVEVAH